jgi:hypothetical protein
VQYKPISVQAAFRNHPDSLLPCYSWIGKHMVSQKQLEANRRNAQRSTGPRTDEGKKVSALNARRHHLTGQVTTMTEADRIMHDAFSASIVENLAPEGAMEIQLAQRIATDSWRLNRISAVEDNLFALGHNAKSDETETDDPEIHAALTAAKVYKSESEQLHLLTLYEQRINRNIQKNLAMLQALQAARLAKHEAEMKEAKKLLQINEMKGLPYDPTKDGFVFSTAEIHAAIDKERRLQRANLTDFSRYKPGKLHARAA